MKRIVWTFGLIAGGIMAAMMFLTIPFADDHGTGSLIVGYTTMVAAFVVVFFGIRRYRDTVLGGTIGFGRAFKAGLLMTLIASACYVASWEVISHTMMPDFAQKYAAAVIAREQAAGASAERVAARRKEMDDFVTAYQNPVYQVGMTFLEVFPVGVVIVLVSAGILSRRRTAANPATA